MMKSDEYTHLKKIMWKHFILLSRKDPRKTRKPDTVRPEEEKTHEENLEEAPFRTPGAFDDPVPLRNGMGY